MYDTERDGPPTTGRARRSVSENTLLTAEQYAYILEDSRAEIVLVSAPLMNLLAPVVAQATACHTAIVVGADDPVAKLHRVETLSFAQVLARALRKLGYVVTITPINQVAATAAIQI